MESHLAFIFQYMQRVGLVDCWFQRFIQRGIQRGKACCKFSNSTKVELKMQKKNNQKAHLPLFLLTKKSTVYKFSPATSSECWSNPLHDWFHFSPLTQQSISHSCDFSLSNDFFGAVWVFFPSLFFSNKVDVLSKTDPAKITCRCHNFHTVCELDMDLYFRQPWGETSLWQRWQCARLQRACASVAACSLSIRMPAPRMGFFPKYQKL